MTETEELQKTIDELADKNRQLQIDLEEAQDKIVDLKYDLNQSEEKVGDLESELSEYEDFESAPEFSAMVDQEKYDLFMDSIGFFSLEQFEEFLKTTKYVKI